MTIVKDRKFQVGDIVVPVRNRYGITNKENNCVCEVINIINNAFMRVKVIKIHNDDLNDYIGRDFAVEYGEFTKINLPIDLLEQGQHVVLENGERCLVLENMNTRDRGNQRFVFVNKDRFLAIDSYDDNLKIKSRGLERFNVDKIMSFNYTNNININILKYSMGKKKRIQ